MRRSRLPGSIAHQTTGRTLEVGYSDWIPVNPVDGSWLTDDPNSVVNSVAATAAGIQLQNNAAAYDHHHDNNEDGGACYYKILPGPDGVGVKFSDPGWNIEFLIKRVTNGDDSGAIGLYISDAPTDRANRNWLGVTYANLINGQGKFYVGTSAGMNSATNAASDRILVHIFNAIDTSADDDGNEITHVISYNNMNDDLAAIHHGAKTNVTQEYDQSDNVFIMLSSSFDNQSTSEPGGNTNNTWQAWYRLNYSPQSVNPEYRLAGRGNLHR